MNQVNEIIENYKKEPIVLYGLSQETEKMLRYLKGYQVVGLLDGYKEEGVLYDVPIINLSQVLLKKVKLIIVVARPGSCKAIARRIGGFCKENAIMLLDMDGNNLLEEKKTSYTMKNMAFFTKQEMLDYVENYDVISFDLFDTLIMRKVLYSTDIFFLVEKKLQERGLLIDNFQYKRIFAEKNISIVKVPTLKQIYEEILKREELPLELAAEYAILEWQVDYETIIPRQDMVDIVNSLVSKRKICIVSDSYYGVAQIRKIMKKAGIDEKIELFISCEYETDKGQNLFKKVADKYGNKSLLHVGDDAYADIKCAKRKGISCFQVLSATEMLERCAFLGAEKYLSNYDTRLKMGLIISCLFNSPFLLHDHQNKIIVKDSFSFGYCLTGVIITDFLLWFYNEIQKKNIHNIWFCARDGYLLQRLYTYLSKEKTVYFLTSRIAAIRAGICTEEDLNYVNDMKFSGSREKQLSVRYGVKDINEDYNIIFEKSRECRKNYQKYISSLQLDDAEIAFFDFVAKGTIQIYSQKFIKNRLKGIYFLKLPNEQKIASDVEIYSYINEKKLQSSSIYRNYYILETILTSPQPSVLEFNEKGKPIYAEETRNERDIACIMDIQYGITSFFQDYIMMKKDSNDYSPEFGELILDLVHQFEIRSEIVDMKVEDVFFNRYTDIQDLL